MTNKYKKTTDFLKELAELSKKHDVWLGQEPDCEAIMYSTEDGYLGICWPTAGRGDKLKPREYEWNCCDS